jgi:phosphopantothenoylcysteine decarboxylase/phosphopantothenate--cysteine ligase
MANLSGKHILLGICGGIAAYKSAQLCRELKRSGADVRVVMTQSACRFIAPLTLQALSGNPVGHDLFEAESMDGMGHIELARWADLVLVAPATAQSMARFAHGQADDLLSATLLASQAPVLLAPAMNHAMWDNPATRDNLASLRQRGFSILGPAAGEQACGETGVGRMLEAEQIAELVEQSFVEPVLEGLQVLMTAGPTREAIDPVRVITNSSSGKMGYAVAEAATRAGASVTLVSGPVSLPAPAGTRRIDVVSAEQMAAAVMANLADCDIFIGVAAVSDYRPANSADHKIKKKGEYMNLPLVRNPDILAMVAAHEPVPFTVGFAAETDNLEENARDKLIAKGIDVIAANPVGGEAGAIDADDNELTLIDRNGVMQLPRAAKTVIARQLIEEIAKRYHETY